MSFIGVDALSPILEPSLEYVTAVTDDECIFQVEHRVREQFRRADTSTAEGANRASVDLEQAGTVVVCVCDPELLS